VEEVQEQQAYQTNRVQAEMLILQEVLLVQEISAACVVFGEEEETDVQLDKPLLIR
jgi:hypothetical protein